MDRALRVHLPQTTHVMATTATISKANPSRMPSATIPATLTPAATPARNGTLGSIWVPRSVPRPGKPIWPAWVHRREWPAAHEDTSHLVSDAHNLRGTRHESDVKCGGPRSERASSTGVAIVPVGRRAPPWLPRTRATSIVPVWAGSRNAIRRNYRRWTRWSPSRRNGDIQRWPGDRPKRNRRLRHGAWCVVRV